MLEDRYYMREPEYRTRSPYLAMIVLFLINLGVFILSQIHIAYGTLSFVPHLMLSPAGLMKGYVWQLFTFQFLHFDRWHFIFNMLGFYLFGRAVLQGIGARHFVLLYVASGLAGGVLQTILGFLVPERFGWPVVGASAGVLGLVAAFAMLEPRREILVMFVLPMQARVILWVATGIAVFYIAVPAEPQIAHGAHLGGIILGYFYIRRGLHLLTPKFNFDWHPLKTRARRRQLVKAASVKAGFWKGSKSQSPEEVEPEEFISREVDPILDKISAHGIQSLTPREKQILEAARAKMDKR